MSPHFAILFLFCFSLGINANQESKFHLLRPHLENNDRVLPNSRVTLLASVLGEENQFISFHLEGVESPNGKDVLLLFSPANADPTKVSPVRILNGMDMGEEYLKSGRFSSEFEVFALSDDYVLRFYKHKEDKLHQAAVSVSLKVSGAEKPSGVHLVVTEKGQINVQWSTVSSFSQSLKFKPVGSTSYTVVTAERDTYNKSQMCGEPASSFGWRDPGSLWSATAAVVAGTKYSYSVGSDKTGWTVESTFSAPPPSNSTKKVTFLAIGDLGTNDNKGCKCTSGPERTLANMVKDPSDLVVHIGDISYARGIASQWPNFLHEISPVASKQPWMTLPGNHERDWINTVTINTTDSGGECGIAFEKRFKMPQTSHDKPWYSFDYGPVHFAFISTELPFAAGTPQNKWLEADLKSVNRSVTPWIVVAGHRPMYISSTNYKPRNGDQPVAEDLRKYVEPHLFKYKVDVGFWGHHHSYQRTCAVNKMICTKGATVHVVVGNAGAGHSPKVQHPTPKFFKYIDTTRWGHTRITVDNKSFKLDFIPNDVKGKVADSFTLTK